MERVTELKFQKLEKKEMNNIYGGKKVVWGKSNTTTTANGKAVGDYMDEDGDFHRKHVGRLWL